MLCEKDNRRLREDGEFLAGIMTYYLRKKIHEADTQDQCRKSQKKAGEATLDDRFTTPLKTSS